MPAPDDRPTRCDYCRRPREEVGHLLHGGGEDLVMICRACATRAVSIFEERDRQRPATPPPPVPLPTPREILARLDEAVVGQERAKRALAVAVSNHFVRLRDAQDRDSPSPLVADASLRHVTIEKSNVLLVGPSGSGKTHLARTLAACVGVPFAAADATTLTEAGYVGEDVESVLHKLLVAAGMDIRAAQGGIVYLDEIDKLRAGQASGAKDMRQGVQHALLRMIEGSVVNVPPSGGYKLVGESCIPFDTSNVLFLCGGAFVGLEGIVARRLGRGSFGFGPSQGGGRGDSTSDVLRHVLPGDLEAFGLIPELVGRLPVVATLDDLGVDDLVRILREPKSSLLDQYRKILKYRNADLEFTDRALREVARIAHERGTGARGLRAVVERAVEGVLFDPAPFTTYVFDEAAVRGGEPGRRSCFGLPKAPLRHRVGRKAAGG